LPGKRPLSFLLFLALGALPAYSFGKAEEAEKPPLFSEWVLCVTAPDVSALPPSRQILGDLLVRHLTDSFKRVDRRQRVLRESAYYLGVARYRARLEASKKLAAKRAERDQLLFRGDPAWKYQKSLKTTDEAIKTLEEALVEAETGPLPVVEDPVFAITASNREGRFPAAPKPGTEYKFCTAEKADAFLTLQMAEYHSRVSCRLRLYLLYGGSFLYEDTLIFSTEDLIPAVTEAGNRLVAALIAVPPAALSITAAAASDGEKTAALPEEEAKEPGILINGGFSGWGSTGTVERTPGMVKIEAFQEGFQSFEGEVDLRPGEFAQLQLNLRPLARSTMLVTVPGEEGARVYQGGIFRGFTPLELQTAPERYEYIQVETAWGKTGSAVFQGPFADADTASGAEKTAVLETGFPYPSSDKRVNRARKGLYSAWGRFWLTLPLALFLQGVSTSYEYAYLYDISRGSEPNAAMAQKADVYKKISIGAWVLLGAEVLEYCYRVYRYLRASGEEGASLQKLQKTEKLETKETKETKEKERKERN